MNANSKLYLAIPSSVAHSARDTIDVNTIRATYIEDFKKLAKQLTDNGFEVCCALDVCSWDRGSFKTALESVSMAWDWMQDCTQVIACPSFNHAASGGVHVEIGWATALGLPLTVITKGLVYDNSALVRGLVDMERFNCAIFSYRKRPREVFDEVLKRVSTLPSLGAQ
jgi:nucleoside 2-deoxyribosyltransferase